MYNIIDFGAKSSSEYNSTKAVQTAVDICYYNGGGTVFVPYGTYTVSTIHLKSHVHFVFEAGATFLGSTNPDDFDKRETVDYPLYQDTSHSFFCRSMFYAEFCEDISFSGFGKIDMQEVWENTQIANETTWSERRAVKIFSLKCCKNILISDLKLYNATDIAVYLIGCEDAKITGLTMKVNIDGISPDCCKNIVISDCNIIAGDDGIVLKSSYGLNKKVVCENIVITNCIVSSRMCAIKLGTETNGGFRNISISNCSVYDTCLTGVALQIADGGELDGVNVTGITMKNVGTPFNITLTDRRSGPSDTSVGSIKNVIIDNLIATGPYEYIEPIQYTTMFSKEELMDAPMVVTSSVTGLPQCNLENISLSNIYLTVPGGDKSKSNDIFIPEEPTATPSSVSYGNRLPSHGIYLKNIQNLNLCNVNISTLKHDSRDAIAFDNIDKINSIMYYQTMLGEKNQL